MPAFTHIQPGSAEEIAGRVELSADARSLLARNPAPDTFVDALRANGLQPDAVRFLAQALPKRRAVWWACLAARAALDAESPPGTAEVLAAAEAWVYKPTDENRRAAQKKAEQINYAHPAAWAAMAAFWADGSLAPVGLPEVKPPEHVAGTTVANTVILTVVKEPQRAADTYDDLLEKGIDIANGGDGRGG